MNSLLTPREYVRYWIMAIALAVSVLALCAAIGPGTPGTREIAWGLPESSTIRELRLMRLGSAALVGAGLALAGVMLQALLRNPLADPYVLGISSGATVGVVGWLLVSTPLLAMVQHGDLPAWIGPLLTHGKAVPALLGALLTCVVVFSLAHLRSVGSLEPITLLLVGVIVNAINGALVLLLNSLVPHGVRSNVLGYLIGYVSEETSLGGLQIAGVVLAAAWAPALLLAGAMNIASLSEAEAASLGVRLPTLRTVCFVASSLATAVAIALAGPIGFVGLLAPHICRLLFGPDHRQLTVTAPCFGAMFLMLADTFVRSTGGIFHGDLPVGVVTALAGGPFFLLLLRRREAWEET